MGHEAGVAVELAPVLEGDEVPPRLAVDEQDEVAGTERVDRCGSRLLDATARRQGQQDDGLLGHGLRLGRAVDGAHRADRVGPRVTGSAALAWALTRQ